VGILLLASRVQAAETCDRACLEGFVDQYLAVLVAQDPSKLPLAKNAGYTENGQELKLGDGMWGPSVTLGNYKLYFADPRDQQDGSDRLAQNERRVFGAAKPGGQTDLPPSSVEHGTPPPRRVNPRGEFVL
jgi:hypothetical protein